jgi:hypothetical protein
VDVFVYTIADGDGDLSTTTLTIDVTDVTLVGVDQTKAVNEAALDLVQDPGDLAPGTVTGSDPSSAAETVTGQLNVAGTGVTYVLDSGSNTYGTLVLNPDGSYSYTLTAPFDTSPDSNNGTNTEMGAESYSYTATDAGGNTVTGTITIDIVDDVPSLGTFTNAIIPNAIGSVGGSFAYDPGADGHGSFAITGPVIDGINYNTVQNANGALLTATADGSGETIFTLQVNTDGTYTFNLVSPDAGFDEVVSLLNLSAGGPSPFLETPDGRIEFTGNSSGVNSSTQGFGIDNQFVGVGEIFTMEFHEPGTPGDDSPNTDPDLISAVTLTNNNINGSLTIQWTATNTVTGDTETGTIAVSGTTTLINPSIDFNLLEVEGISGSGQGVRFTQATLTRSILPNDQDLGFTVTATDGDGDVTMVQSFDVFVDASAPVVLDLDGDGVEFVGIEAGITFDYGQGLVATAWAGADDGVLARNTGGSYDVVFTDDLPGAVTDLEGLAAFDSNGDGALSASDAVWGEFGVLHNGSFSSLDAMGITSISLSSDGISYSAANGDVLVDGSGTFTWADGSAGILADATFRLGGEQRLTDYAIASAAMAGFLASMPIAAAAQDGPALSALIAVPFDGIGYVEADLAAIADGGGLGGTALGLFANGSPGLAETAEHGSSPMSAMEHLDNPLGESGDAREGAVAPEQASPEALDPATISFGSPDMAAPGLMEALLALGEGGAPAPAGDAIAVSVNAPEAVADALAGKIIDALIEQFADGNTGQHHTQDQDVQPAVLAEFLGLDIGGHSAFAGLAVNEVSVDEAADAALMHG